MKPGAGISAALLLAAALARAEELKPPPLPPLPKSPEAVAAEEARPSRLGIKAYVARDDAEAVRQFRRALDEDASDETSRRLLLKAYFRLIHQNFERKDYDRAWTVVAEARRYFPDNATIRELAARPAASPPPSAAKPAGKAREPARPAAAPPPDAAVLPAAKAGPPRRDRPAPLRAGASAAFIAFVVGLAVAEAVRRRDRRLQTLVERLRRSETEKADLTRGLKERDRRREELQAELERRAREAQARLEDSEVKLRDAAARARPAVPAPRPPEPLLVEMTPPDRDEDAGRIAREAEAIYGESPEEALRFLRGLAGERSGPARVLLAPVLARVRHPESLDLLLELAADPRAEVRREVLKALKALAAEPDGLPAAFLARARAVLHEEKAKGEWVF